MLASFPGPPIFLSFYSTLFGHGESLGTRLGECRVGAAGNSGGVYVLTVDWFLCTHKLSQHTFHSPHAGCKAFISAHLAPHPWGQPLSLRGTSCTCQAPPTTINNHTHRESREGERRGKGPTANLRDSAIRSPLHQNGFILLPVLSL